MSPGWYGADELARQIVLIYARAADGTIGHDGGMPWHLPADLKRFKAMTMGKPMVMGRKTFDSLPGRLPGRRHIVLTRDPDWRAEGAEVAHSPGDALLLAGDGDVAVIGGAEVLDLFMPLATRVELTEVHARFDGDTHMAALGGEWREVAREDHDAAGTRSASTPAFSFVTFERA